MSRIKKLFKTLYITVLLIVHTRADIVVFGHTFSDYRSMLHSKGK